MQFFDNLGVLNETRIPQECVQACTVPGGDAHPMVRAWVNRLQFNVPQYMARKALREYGAWTDLQTADDETINARVLWLACHSLKAGEVFVLGFEPCRRAG